MDWTSDRRAAGVSPLDARGAPLNALVAQKDRRFAILLAMERAQRGATRPFRPLTGPARHPACDADPHMRLLSQQQMDEALKQTHRDTVLKIEPADLVLRGSRHPARMIFAALARGYTKDTLPQLSGGLGLSRRDSVPNLLRRFKTAPEDIQQQLTLIRLQLGLSVLRSKPAEIAQAP